MPRNDPTENGNPDELRTRLLSVEAELRAARAFEEAPYRAVVEDMSELVVRWEPDGTRRFINDAYCRLFGATREELIGTSFWPLIVPEDRERVRARIAGLTPDEPVSVGIHRAVGLQGVFWMEWVDRALFDGNGKLVEYQSVGRDITDRVKLEEQARRLAAADARARTSAAVAHDLRNMLTVIAGQGTLLREQLGGRAELHLLEQAVGTAKRMLGQLDTVDYGNPLAEEVIEVDVAIRDLVPVLKAIAGPRCKLLFDLQSAARVRVKSTQLDQVLLNLVRNAAEAIDDSGTIRVTTRRASGQLSSESHHGLDPNCGYVLISVQDTGSGIDTALLPRIFDPYVSTKRDGHGLGLATVKAFAEGHGGSVNVETSSSGTVFTVAIPEVGTDRA